MAEVQRGNVFLTIEDDEIEKYMSKGFSVIDKFGRIIKQCVPTELNQLQKAYSEHIEIIRSKDEEIAKLKSELNELKLAGAKKAPAIDSVNEEKTEQVEVPVKRGRKSR